MRDKHEVINIDAYLPYFLSTVSNSISRGASAKYLEEFGIGIVEWRVVSILASEPNISAARICKVVALDKSAASKALSRLHGAGWLGYSASPTADARRKIWCLNRKGFQLHSRILEIALERERKLIAGVDPAELETFLRVMRILRVNVETID